MSASRTFGLTFKEVLLIDSTTIRLFSDILKGVGRFIKITEAKAHDKTFLKSLDLISHSMIVFDKAYNYYHQFAVKTGGGLFEN